MIAVIDSNARVERAWVQDGGFMAGYGLEAAAIEAVRSTPFTPAKYNGKPVSVQIGIPVIFKLDARVAYDTPPTDAPGRIRGAAAQLGPP
ncbi:MAG: energy transducer TonB [bacterium]|nr:energy transducer TonB [candidate division KSB1 bacterium]MDH7561340.1 energy transducer TonB [bacterium]